MKLVSFTCPGCAAQLTVDVDSKQAACPYCGLTFPVDDEIRHVQFDGAEQAGYEFEKGRLRAQREQAAPQVVYVQQPPVQPVKKRRTWLWVLGWIFIFPVPLTLIMLNNASVKEQLSPKVRYGIIAAGWLLYLAIGVFGGGEDSTDKNTNTNTSSAVVTQVSDSSASASSGAAV